MSCHPKHIEPPPLDPPPLERRQRLLEAGRLRAQGLTLRQIADRMECSHTTVSTYLEELEQHRFHLLQAVAVDQLLDTILDIASPAEEQVHLNDRLHAARELRLLLSSLPKLVDHDERQRYALAEYEGRVRGWREYAAQEQQQKT